MAGNLDHVGVGLGHPGGHRADAHFGHQLHGHLGARVDLVQIKDQLGQILDRVDVMVGRRRNQGYAGLRSPQHGDVGADLLPGELTALTGFRPLGHLDFDLLGAHQVFRGHAKAPRSHLLNRGAGRVAVPQALQVREGGGQAVFVHIVQGGVAARIFAAFAGVGLAANPVHGDRQHLVGFRRQRTEGHAARAEPLQNRFDRLHLVHGNRAAAGVEVQQVPQGRGRTLLQIALVDAVVVVGFGAEGLRTGHPFALGRLGLEGIHGLVQGLGHFRRVHVVFAALAVLDEAHVFQLLAGQFGERRRVEGHHFLGQFRHAQATNAGRRAHKGQVDQLAANPDRLENLRPMVASQQRDSHLRKDLQQPGFHGGPVVGLGLLDRAGRQLTAAH